MLARHVGHHQGAAENDGGERRIGAEVRMARNGRGERTDAAHGDDARANFVGEGQWEHGASLRLAPMA